MRSQVVDVPVGPWGRLVVVGHPGTQATRTRRAPQVNVIAALKLHHSQAPDLNPGIARAEKYQRVCPRHRLNGHLMNFLFSAGTSSFSTLAK